MDPPPSSSEEEWRSLVEETSSDVRQASRPPRGGFKGGGARRPPSTNVDASAKTSSPAPTSSALSDLLNKNVSGFSFRHMLIVFILAGMVGILVIITSNAEVSTETAMVTEVELVHHDGGEVSVAADASSAVTVDASATIPEKDATDATETIETSKSKATLQEGISAESAPETDDATPPSPETSKSTSNNSLMGFHDPSPESFTHANYYLKPKGAGYPLAPKGGLHPIYIRDAASEEEMQKLVQEMNNDHDTYQETSPYADARLKMTDEERDTENKSWRDHLEGVRNAYGYWDFKDNYQEKNGGIERPVVDFEAIGKMKKEKDEGYNILHGEIDKEDFPEGSWQTDDEYVQNLLDEARKLIHRVQEGIYAEYGWATASLTEEQLSERKVNFGVHLLPQDEPHSKSVDASMGIAWMYEDSFRHFVKKLLNALITNDHFFVILGGHSAAAGHGNNFHQSYMMQFHEIMEPVFDRLGMVLVSANRAQGGMGTLQASLAGTSIYGEKDFMLWDSSMTEKGGGHQDVFFRQMMLTGHRTPILFDMGGGKPTLDNLHDEVGAYVGGLTMGNPSHIEQTTSVEQAKQLPFAVAHLFCASGNDSCNSIENKYNAHCWTDRVDIEPSTVQSEKYGSQVSWHPGFRTHKWIGRRLALVFLHALEEALTLWEKTASTEGNPLDGKHWHISQEEQDIREKLKQADASKTACGQLMADQEKPIQICTTPMRGATQWAPRADPDHSSIISLLKPSPNGYVPGLFENPVNLYNGRDPHFPSQKIPDGEVDVATIARSIAPQSTHRRVLAEFHAEYSSRLENTRQQTTKYPQNQTKQLRSRDLSGDSTVVPGEGWTVLNHPSGFCDGTSNAECKRQEGDGCLMGGHNDSRSVLKGDGLSGWLVFDLKDVKEGLFMARTEIWHAHNSNPRTEGWTSENNVKEGRRGLKAPPPPLPDDFTIEVAVNGEVLYKVDEEGLKARCSPKGEIAYNVSVCKFVDNPELASNNNNNNMEVAIRVTGSGRESVLAISHVYYA